MSEKEVAFRSSDTGELISQLGFEVTFLCQFLERFY